MPERSQALIKTRCPACATIFRVTSAQLRQKAGKVRCGQCHALFNAFDQLVSHSDAAGKSGQDESLGETFTPAAASAGNTFEPTPEPIPEPIPEPVPEPGVESQLEVADATQAGREAGLVAARELVDTTNYNRWSEGVLAGNGIDKLDMAPAKKSVPWLALFFSLILALLLLLQLAYHFRTALTLQVPALAEVFANLEIDVPLPKDAALLAIEDSDLQADQAKSVYVLQATLKNRAPFAQAWPALELSLTDVNDALLARRVIEAVDYLPPEQVQPAFDANGERAVQLLIDAKNLAASGYRLYLFYH